MPTNSREHRENSNEAEPAALQPLPAGVRPGADVDLRGRRWRVERTIVRDDCCELHVAAATAAGHRVFLWPSDRPAPVDRNAPFSIVRLRHWWRGLAAASAHEIGPWTPRARTVNADVLPYQLEPAIAMARGMARIVLADEVGLGKTVQAAWIIADLVERERDARVLVAVPAGLRRQWHAEVDALFGLTAFPVDAVWLRAAVADLPADVSPWSAPGVYIGSVDFLKRTDVAESLWSQPWDLLVVDEAHGSTAPTDRHAALAAVAVRARRVVTITATPFSGDAARFMSLAALGDLGGSDPTPVMFRRSREDTGDGRRRRHRIVTVRITRAEFRLQRLLERYSRDVWREASGGTDGARLAVTILRKRALSSSAAVERSLRRRLALLQGSPGPPRQLSLFDEEDVADDDLMDSALGVPGLADMAREHRWLATMIDAAARAGERDSKLRRLTRLLARVREEAAIVFTEYRDTLRHLAAALPGALQLHGGMTAADRAAVQRRFNDRGGWLLATDAASEGLNLQHRCRFVVNYELPWNPARLEQRIGRVDRIGQPRSVHAVTLVARDTAEDLVVANLTKRLARVAATLGQRDRLAAFLDEARVARSVIGGSDALPIVEPAESLDCATAPDPELREAAARAAADIRRRLATPDRWTSPPLACTRATAARPPGCIVTIRCTARTRAGVVVAERLAIAHVGVGAVRPARAADIRLAAVRAIRGLIPHTRDALPDVGTWFEDVQRGHRGSIDAQLAREIALRDRRVDVVPVQRGLFDRRAIAAADRESAAGAALQAAADDRIRDLEHSRELELAVSPAGALVLWR